MKNRKVDLIINTPSGKTPHADEVSIRSTAVRHKLPLFTTATGAAALVNAIETLKDNPLKVKPLQEY